MQHSKYWFDIDGKLVPDEQAMVAHLLEEDVLFVNSRRYIADDKTNEIGPETLILFVNCSDVFVWACSDAECVSCDELPELFRLYEANPQCGPIQWVCIKRNEKPQAPMVKYLKEHNGWNDILEKLPDNKYDTLCNERYKSKQQ